MKVILSYIDDRYTDEALTRFPLKNGIHVSRTAMVRPSKVVDRLKNMFCNGVIIHSVEMEIFSLCYCKKTEKWTFYLLFILLRDQQFVKELVKIKSNCD